MSLLKDNLIGHVSPAHNFEKRYELMSSLCWISECPFLSHFTQKPSFHMQKGIFTQMSSWFIQLGEREKFSICVLRVHVNIKYRGNKVLFDFARPQSKRSETHHFFETEYKDVHLSPNISSSWITLVDSRHKNNYETHNHIFIYIIHLCFQILRATRPNGGVRGPTSPSGSSRSWSGSSTRVTTPTSSCGRPWPSSSTSRSRGSRWEFFKRLVLENVGWAWEVIPIVNRDCSLNI